MSDGQAAGPPETPPERPPRWRADEDHRRAADRLADALSQVAFDDVCESWRRRISDVGTLNAECLSDGPPSSEASAEEVAAYAEAAKVWRDDEPVWPVVLVDEHGRRFEVEVEVTIHPVAPVPIALAEHERDAARYARLTAQVPPGGTVTVRDEGEIVSVSSTVHRSGVPDAAGTARNTPAVDCG